MRSSVVIGGTVIPPPAGSFEANARQGPSGQVGIGRAPRGRHRAFVIAASIVTAVFFGTAGVVVAMSAADDGTAGTTETSPSGVDPSTTPDGPNPAAGASGKRDADEGAVVAPLAGRLDTSPTGGPQAPGRVLSTATQPSAPADFNTGPAPATVSTLSEGDPGFGWPATAFGKAQDATTG